MANKSHSNEPGIVSMACYFPKLYVSQSELEKHNKVSAGKYTIGLGQDKMAFVSDREDICSISMTVLSRLMQNNQHISYSDIGWVCVATETILDHSKSVSSMLMQLFRENGNEEIEGIDVKHACYGGTFALFSAFDRVSSKYWDGKYCVVIAADIAEYAEGPARCTGGCGAVALLVGENGCIELEIPRASFKAHEYDFYKPNLNSSYPVVNGHVSNGCYLNALDSCYATYQKKAKQKDMLIPQFDYWCFHSPYNKLVRKSFGRIMYNDFLAHREQFNGLVDSTDEKIQEFLDKYGDVPVEETRDNREVIKGFERLSRQMYDRQVEITTTIPKQIGNCYTASIFMGLVSLVTGCKDDVEGKLAGKRIAMFSYGSGTVASLYTFKVHSSAAAVKQLQAICDHNDIESMLSTRKKVDCISFSKIMAEKEGHHERVEFPVAVVEDSVAKNAFYLREIDATKQRFYSGNKVIPKVLVPSGLNIFLDDSLEKSESFDDDDWKNNDYIKSPKMMFKRMVGKASSLMHLLSGHS